MLPAARLLSVRFSLSTSIALTSTALALAAIDPVALPSVSVALRLIFSARTANEPSLVRLFSSVLLFFVS